MFLWIRENVTERNATLFRNCSQRSIDLIDVITYKKNLNYKPEGRRNIGRPLTRWEDYFREEGTGQGP